MQKTIATRDLTVGDPMKLILGFALSLFWGMLFQQLYNIIDTAIVANFLGKEAYAGVGSTGAINFLIMGFYRKNDKTCSRQRLCNSCGTEIRGKRL